MGRWLVLPLCLALWSCERGLDAFMPRGISPGLLIGGDIVSLANTRKTMADHVMSMVSGKDCSTLRAQDGDDYCIEHVKWLPRETPMVYCYRSLGTPTCYDRPLAGVNSAAIGAGNEPRVRAVSDR
ncbi:MAG: hypothetical protein HQL33_06390 [Alphaproteobacteria bacterium]|nr:hypothetical protein [Alphaproteobacteria bacterium]MBF0129602.1 hypothetical protein [Alphaproteobacteria bacterium]